MINTSKAELIFLKTGAALDVAARSAAVKVLGAVDVEAAYALAGGSSSGFEKNAEKFSKLLSAVILPSDRIQLNEAYFNAILATNLGHYLPGIQPTVYAFLTGEAELPKNLTHGKQLARGMRTWFSTWLLALHHERALILPFSFSIPTYVRADGARGDTGQSFYSPLLRALRSVNSAESAVSPFLRGLTESQRGELISYGAKSVLALGWIDGTDANVTDLAELRRANAETGFISANSPPSLTLLVRAGQALLGEEFPVTVDQWEAEVAIKKIPFAPSASLQKLLKKSSPSKRGTQEKGLANLETEEAVLDFTELKASHFAPQAVQKNQKFGGALKCNFELAEKWLTVEVAYINKIRRESYKSTNIALGNFNAYLFGYLASWKKSHPDFLAPFPESPNQLRGSFFVSRVVPQQGEESPITFVEFLERLQDAREWTNEYVYSLLKQMESFFDFVALYQDDLPGCKGFIQPISEHDYPRISKSLGTNKGLIPRSVFGFLIAYIESLASFSEAILEKSLNGECSWAGSSYQSQPVLSIQDGAEVYGVCPIMFWGGKAIALNRIPNLLSPQSFMVKTPDGALCQRVLPRPHAVHQLLVAMQTGLRLNHIQWLDLETFDAKASDGEAFTKLWVNTDKSKSSSWTPFVSASVIDTLRKQRRWRACVAEPGFQNKVFYNNNPRSKWGSFLPLFSYGASGRPNPDGLYSEAFKAILMGAQWTMLEAGLACPILAKLSPPGVGIDGHERQLKLQRAGSLSQKATRLTIASDITPHSARVSVVSHYITALPAQFIGNHITGQTPAVVSHYVKLDPDMLTRERQQQGIRQGVETYQKAFEDLIAGSNSSFIHADGRESRIAEAMREDMEKTLSDFGCVSVGGNEEAQSGVDVLRSSVGRNAAFNKTEICPHGNHCPSEVIKELKATHRCGVCPRAVRSIDHLPAVAAKCRQVFEELSAFEKHVDAQAGLSSEEADLLETQRQRLCEDLVGWVVAQEVLEGARKQCASNATHKRWVAQRPEILERELSRVKAPNDETRYLLSRLAECQAYPNLQSASIKAQFELLRRKLAARLGDFQKAFETPQAANPGQECVGLLRTIVEAHQLSFDQLAGLLSDNQAFALLPTLANEKLIQLGQEPFNE